MNMQLDSHGHYESMLYTLYTKNTKQNPTNHGLTEEFKLHNQENLPAGIYNMETNVNSNKLHKINFSSLCS
jgi:hypothetical protein